MRSVVLIDGKPVAAESAMPHSFRTTAAEVRKCLLWKRRKPRPQAERVPWADVTHGDRALRLAYTIAPMGHDKTIFGYAPGFVDQLTGTSATRPSLRTAPPTPLVGGVLRATPPLALPGLEKIHANELVAIHEAHVKGIDVQFLLDHGPHLIQRGMLADAVLSIVVRFDIQSHGRPPFLE